MSWGTSTSFNRDPPFDLRSTYLVDIVVESAHTMISLSGGVGNFTWMQRLPIPCFYLPLFFHFCPLLVPLFPICLDSRQRHQQRSTPKRSDTAEDPPSVQQRDSSVPPSLEFPHLGNGWRARAKWQCMASSLERALITGFSKAGQKKKEKHKRGGKKYARGMMMFIPHPIPCLALLDASFPSGLPFELMPIRNSGKSYWPGEEGKKEGR